MAVTENILVKFDYDSSSILTAQQRMANASAEGKKLSDNVTKFGNEMKSAGSTANESMNKIGNSLKSVAAAIGLAFGVNEVIQFANKSIEAFKDAEKAAHDLEFAVKQVGKEGDAAVDKLLRMADKLSSKNNYSIFDNDDIVKVEAMLTTLGLTTQQVEQLIPSIIDAASVTGDLAGTADKFANGINGRLSPELKKLGINFDATGDRQENFNRLIAESAKLTGAAGAALETAAGQAKVFENQIGDLQEEIGEKLAPMWNEARLQFLSYFNAMLDGIKRAQGLSVFDKSLKDRAISDYQSLTDSIAKTNDEAAKEQIKKQIAFENARLATSIEYAKRDIKSNEQRIRTKAGQDLAYYQELQKAFAAIDAEAAKNKKPTSLGLTEEEIARRKQAAETAAKEAQAEAKRVADEIKKIDEENFKAAENNLKRWVAEKTEIIVKANLTDVEQEYELTKLQEEELEIRLQNYIDYARETGDVELAIQANRIEGIKKANADAKRVAAEIKQIDEDNFQAAEDNLQRWVAEQTANVSAVDREKELTRIKMEELQIRKQNYIDYGKDIGQIERQIAELTIETSTKTIEAEKALMQQAIDGVIQLINEMSAAVFDVRKQWRDADLESDLEAIEKQKDEELKSKRLTTRDKEKIEIKYEQDVAKRKTEAAIAEREASINQAYVNGALAITKAFATATNFAQALVEAAFIASNTFIQVQAIKARPLPRYAKGTRYVSGAGTETSDSIPALLSKGEAVISASTNKKYAPILDSIHNGFIPAELLNSIALNYSGIGSAINYEKIGHAVGKEVAEAVTAIEKSNRNKQNVVNVIVNTDNNHRK